MTRLICALALALVVASPAAARPWVVDPAASNLGFRVNVEGQPVKGTFRRWTANIAFDPAALATSKASVTIDMASAASGDAERDTSLVSADWFSTKSYPKATFVTRSIRAKGGTKYEAVGDLTIRGVSRPIVLPFNLVIVGDKARMTSQVSLDRTAFGVGGGQFSTGDYVDTRVTVVIDLTARGK